MASSNCAQDRKQGQREQDHVEAVNDAKCRLWVLPRPVREPAVQDQRLKNENQDCENQP